jgi:hypothetical protein
MGKAKTINSEGEKSRETPQICLDPPVPGKSRAKVKVNVQFCR